MTASWSGADMARRRHAPVMSMQFGQIAYVTKPVSRIVYGTARTGNGSDRREIGTMSSYFHR